MFPAAFSLVYFTCAGGFSPAHTVHWLLKFSSRGDVWVGSLRFVAEFSSPETSELRSKQVCFSLSAGFKYVEALGRITII